MRSILYILLVYLSFGLSNTPLIEEIVTYNAFSGQTFNNISTPDSGIIIIGTFEGINPTDIFVLKVNAQLDTVFFKVFDWGISEIPITINRSDKNTYIINALTRTYDSEVYDLLLLKIDSLGNEIWHKKFGGTGEDRGYIVQTFNEQYHFIIGETESFGAGKFDVWLLKTDMAGDTIWTRTFGTEQNDNAGYINLTKDKNLLITGKTESSIEGATKIFLMKVDLDGNIIWYNEYESNYAESPYYCAELESGKILISGYVDYDLDDRYEYDDVLIIKTESDGTFIERNYFGDSINREIGGWAIKMNQGYLITGKNYGTYRDDGFFVRLNEEGNIIWEDYIILPDDYFRPMFTLNANNSLYFSGTNNNAPFCGRLEEERVVSSFKTNQEKGFVPFNSLFIDSSITNAGEVNSWRWDFENDGIIDSYEKDPVHTYLDADTYSVKLIASNGLIADTLIKENYIIAYFDSIPNLYSVEDISDDQGGWVEIDFARSFYDTDISNTSESYSIELNDGNGWTSVMDTLASAKNIYSILVPTPLDSNAYSEGLLSFRVIANMDEGTFTSDSVQGYSIDNIYPATPQNLTTRLTDELYAELSWSSVADIDFSHYLLYRSILGSPLELFKTLTDTFCTDSTVVLDNTYAYALQSVDSSGNTSELSNSVEMLIDNPPQISTLPLISFNEDDSLTYPVSDWYPYITDPDHPDSILIIDIISNNNIFSRFESDHFIFKAKENWYGSDSLEFILSDGTLSDSTMLFFNVRSINDPPQIIGLPDSIVFVIDSSFTLTMNDYGFDIDSPDSLLKWNFEIENDSIMINYDSLSTHLMISSYHFIGQTYLWCMVTDDSGLTGIDSIMLRIDPVTALEDQLRIDIPEEYVLFQNYPNPFNPTTTIRYGLKEPGEVKIIIYDNLGRKITELINTRQNAGYHQVVWDGKNYLNQQISSGIYYYKLIAENYTAMKKMIFIK